MARTFVLYKCYSVPIDIYSTVGILYSPCCVLANWQIYHSRGMLLLTEQVVMERMVFLYLKCC